VTQRADRTAICNHCGRRFCVYKIDETLWFHKVSDRSKKCPGSSTFDYDDKSLLPVQRRPKLRYRYDPPVKLLEIEHPTHLRVKPPGTGDLISNKSFRLKPYENWLNRWERKFHVKIPDKNVVILTKGKFTRRSTK